MLASGTKGPPSDKKLQPWFQQARQLTPQKGTVTQLENQVVSSHSHGVVTRGEGRHISNIGRRPRMSSMCALLGVVWINSIKVLEHRIARLQVGQCRRDKLPVRDTRGEKQSNHPRMSGMYGFVRCGMD